MQPTFALVLFFSFIGWLFVRERKLRPMSSGALWIVLAWVFITGTRPVSGWLGGVVSTETPGDYLEGNPLDASVLLILTLFGLIILIKRRIDWINVLNDNYYIALLVIYFGISIVWSDYPFVSFKRYFKEVFASVIMSLIIVTDKNSEQAFRAVFIRYSYLAIVISVLFVKYFPEMGRYYNRWTWEYSYCGVTGGKNELGYILFICGLVLIWDLLQMFGKLRVKFLSVDVAIRVVVLLMMSWLITIAHSLTGLACLILGAAVLVIVGTSFGMRQVSHLITLGSVLGFVVIVLASVPGSFDSLTKNAGRDATLTGRTEIWSDLLGMQEHPVLGSGFHSFWLGANAEQMWDKYYFHPVQAHNGYLETYLNGGFVGLCLLMAMLVSAAAKLRKGVLQGDGYGAILFAFFISILFYNITEAMFMGPTLIWVVLLIAALKCRKQSYSVLN